MVNLRNLGDVRYFLEAWLNNHPEDEDAIVLGVPIMPENNTYRGYEPGAIVFQLGEYSNIEKRYVPVKELILHPDSPMYGLLN